MADKKKQEVEKAIEIEKAIAAEFSANDDIVDYIEGKKLNDLRLRYSAAEEDSSLLDESFSPSPKSSTFRKQKPGGMGYYYDPRDVSEKNEPTVKKSHLSELFSAADSEYDNDSISFKDINLDEKTEMPSPIAETKTEAENISEKKEETAPEEPPKKKRGRPKKVVEETPAASKSKETTVENSSTTEEPPKKKRGRPKKVVVEEAPATSEETEKAVEEVAPPINSMSPVYNTNTKVVYFDDKTDDGIKRNTDEEITSVFSRFFKKMGKKKHEKA